MKQQINLYQVEKQKWVFNITFQYLIWSGIVFLSILFVVTIQAVVNHIAAKSELTQLQKDQINKSKALKTMISQMPEEHTREKLVNELKNYEAEKQVKQGILAALAVSMPKNKGFSTYLEALSTKTRSGLWFTQLSFEEKGNVISLVGSAAKPEFVPNLITDLSNDPAFAGKQFELFKVSLDEKREKVNFVLKTKAAKQS